MNRRLALAAGLLALAALACGGGGPDVDATVNAVSTAVQSTLIAMTPVSAATSSATPQATIGVPPTPTGTLPPTPTQFVPPTNTPPGPGPSATPGATGPERPNGTLIHATHLTTAPTIDAQGGDWPSPLPNTIDQNVFKPANWSGTADQVGHFAIGWDANNLYLFVVVNDELHVQIQHGELLYQGDSLELQLDTDLAGDFDTRTLSPDDHQLGLSPGQNSDAPEAYLWNPAGKRGTPTGLTLSSRATGDQGGYALEVAIPWSMYGLTPTGGLRLGFALNSSDDDQPGVAVQESMISTVSTRTLTDPTTWGTLQLDP